MIWLMIATHPISTLVGSLVWLGLFIAVLRRAGRLKLSGMTRAGLIVLMFPVAGMIFLIACAINESAIEALVLLPFLLSVLFPPFGLLLAAFWITMFVLTIRHARRKKTDMFLYGIFAALTGPVALILLILDGFDWLFPVSQEKGQRT